MFSVTMYYHFAFVAISVTMFGMAVGALAVFLPAGRLHPPSACRVIWRSARRCSRSAIVAEFPDAPRDSVPVELSLVSVYALA